MRSETRSRTLTCLHASDLRSAFSYRIRIYTLSARLRFVARIRGIFFEKIFDDCVIDEDSR